MPRSRSNIRDVSYSKQDNVVNNFTERNQKVLFRVPNETWEWEWRMVWVSRRCQEDKCSRVTNMCHTGEIGCATLHSEK